MSVGIVPALRDGALRDREGLLLGRVEDLLFDAETHRPAWLVVVLAGEGAVRTLAPAAGSRARVDGWQLGVAAEAVRDCPVLLHGGGGVPPLREHVAAAARWYGVRRGGVESYSSVALAA